jgi:hypothetical protein
VQVQLRAPRETAGLDEPCVGRTAALRDARARRDAALGVGVARGDFRGFVDALRARDGQQLELQHALVARAEQREQAVRRDVADRLGMVEVVRELRALGLLAVDDLRTDAAVEPKPVAQLADERGILREALHEDRARAVQRGLRVGDAFRRVDIAVRGFRRGQRRIGEQRVGERLEAGLARDLRLRAALRLVRQVEVLEARLRVGRTDLGLERGFELALLGDRREHGVAPLLELAQVAQALVEQAQLRVVEAARGLLAVARDERHGRARVEQRDGGVDLGGFGVDVCRNDLVDVSHWLSDSTLHRPAASFLRKWGRPCQRGDGA